MARLGRAQPNRPVISRSQVNQYGRPDADDAAGSWTVAPLFSKVDEVTAADSDEISSETLVAAGNTTNADLSLGTLVDPVTGVNHVLRVRAKVTFTLGINGGIRGELRQGGSLIATLTTDALTTGYITYEYALSVAEADAITDYTALFVRLYGVFPVGSLGGVQVSWVEFDIPPMVAAATTNAPAGVAAATGAAYGATTSIASGTGAPGATGAAGGPASSIAVSAGLASGTGAANNASVTTTVVATAGVAAGTGAANSSTVTISAGTGNAGATGSAGGSTSTVAPVVGVAAGTGAAHDATTMVAATAGVAAGTGVAYDTAASLAAGTGVAGATGAAGGSTSLVAPVVGSAAATGAAYDATITVGTIANAGVATATGTAGGPGSLVAVGAGVAAATGAAYDATVVVVQATGPPGSVDVSATHGHVGNTASHARALVSSTHAGLSV